MAVPLFHVDAFTDQPFAGNPAAVCLLPEARDERWMQHVAAEMNLSETAFVLRQEGGFGLRWFTPKVEVDLCGHATLASAHVLWQEGQVQPGELIRFHTRSGVLQAARSGEQIELDFPLTPEEPVSEPPRLSEVLAVPLRYVGKSRFDYLVEVDSEATLRRLTPNMPLLATLPIRGLIVTSRSEKSEFDFVSRFFAPAAGVNEDPVTARPIAAWRPTGKRSCIRTRLWHTKHQHEVASYGCEFVVIVPSWVGRLSSWLRVNCLQVELALARSLMSKFYDRMATL